MNNEPINKSEKFNFSVLKFLSHGAGKFQFSKDNDQTLCKKIWNCYSLFNFTFFNFTEGVLLY